MKHTKTITILHSNDLHGDFLAEQVDEKLVGGVSMLSGYIEKVRAEEPNTIYAIAGDMFRGSVIDSEYKGLSTIEIMNALAPDVVTIGNHEVDYGIAHLLFIEKCARFPIINANLYIKNTSTRLFTPYKILRMDGMNILFIGIITQDVINQTKSESLVGSFVDTAAAAAEVGKICNAHNSIDIDFTVLLTHIGFEEDRHLARQLDPAWGVDLIIGGHSHTLPEHAVEENGVVIAQAGTGTDQIGRFDIIVDTDNNCIDSYTWRTVPICAETCPRNPAMEQVLHRFTSQVDEKYSHIVGRFRRELTHPQRTQETELGNLFADIFTRSLGVDVMLIGSGSIRAEKLGPIVTYGDLIEGFPYDDGVFMFKVTGQQLRQMLHYMLREEAYTCHTEFYQLPSTLRLRYDRRKGDFDYFTYCGREVGKEIGDDALFTVGMQNYHFKNIESFFNISYDTLCKLQKPRSVATSCQDILMEYFREHEMLDAVVDGRMTILPPTAREGDWPMRTERRRRPMRTFSLVLLGLAVGAALLSRSPSRPAPTPPEPAAATPTLADLETLEFWERGSYIRPISRTCLTRTPEGTRVELELYHEEVYQEQAGPELLEQAKAILEEYGVGGWAGFSGHDPNVLDGKSFRLEATLADGTRIEAHGENKFPPNYRDVMSALDDLTAAAQKNALQQYTP